MNPIHQPDWRFGANFIVSTAINQLEMWQEATFDPVTIDRELTWAQKIGMSVMRVFLHDLAFHSDKDGFLRRMQEYLDIATAHGIVTLFVFFDDCWNSSFAPGPQPAPQPYRHNSGWLQSPGNRAADDPAERGRLENYVKSVLTRFGDKPEIFGWDLYNEPGNGQRPDGSPRGSTSLPLLRDVFRWARDIAPTQPLTAAVWQQTNPAFAELNAFQLAASDLASFHCYEPPDALRRTIAAIRHSAPGKPLLCSEYMARTAGSTFAACLPLLREEHVTAINWGLVAGKTQTIYPWGWSPERGEPPRWFHDVFRPDGSLYDPAEGEVFATLRAAPEKSV